MGSGGVSLNPFEGRNVLTNVLDPFHLTDKKGGGGAGGPGEFDGVPAPVRPEYQSLMDDKTGLLKSQYNTNWSPDMDGYNQVKKNALETGPSAWAKAAEEAQSLKTQGLQDSSQQQGASAEAQARSSLASKYGLSPAAQQRLAMQNQRSQMTGMQNIGFQDAAAKAGIGVQDQQRKDTMLGNLTGLANTNAQGNAQSNQFNITNAIGESQNKNKQNLDAYQAQMAAWGAGKTADATRAAGAAGGGGKK